MSGFAATRSIRFRITALAALVVLGVLLLAGIGLVVVQRRVLIEGLTESLDRRADEIATSLAARQAPEERVGVGDDDAYVVVTAADGSVVWSAPAGVVVDEDTPGFLEVTRAIETPNGSQRVVVAGPLDDIDEATRVLVVSLAVAIPVVVGLLATLIWWLIGRTLRPVESIRSEVAGIGGSDLHRRVPLPDSGDEIESLARTMNDMLGRIEDATERQRQFVADASHELRTPLTRMRTQLEVELRHPSGAASDIEQNVLDDTLGMQRLVDDLLYLARSDSGAQGQPRRERVDLDEIVHAQASRFVYDGVAIHAGPFASVQVAGDARALDRAVANVVENAARYATTEVTLTTQQKGESVVLLVADDGPGIPPADRERIFERFARVDGARSTTTGGTGLGLSIARDIIERHGGTISVDPTWSAGARFSIRLPGARDG
jgi:signal transduction histidine kinase